MNEIELFVPYPFEKKEYNLDELNKRCNVRFQYVSKGRFAVIHVLRSYEILNGSIGVCGYLCPSVADTLKKYGYNVVYYDIDPSDLNPSVRSIEKIIEKYRPLAIVVASLYGNPADLERIESVCRSKGIILIDDAAQSFGAKIGDRMVGTFGDGGFFSLSPGKPAAGHMGGYYWTRRTYSIKYKKNFLYHYAALKYFLHVRYYAYDYHKIRRFFWKIIMLILKDVDIINDGILTFEKEIVSGIIDATFKEAYAYRKQWFSVFEGLLKGNGEFRLIKPVRGICNSSKIVLIFVLERQADTFASYIQKKGIRIYRGYSFPDTEQAIECVKNIVGKIVELPIDPNPEKMQYLYQVVKDYID